MKVVSCESVAVAIYLALSISSLTTCGDHILNPHTPQKTGSAITWRIYL